MAKQVTCPRCHKPLALETEKELQKKYKYYCPECDENYFEFEAIVLYEPEYGG